MLMIVMGTACTMIDGAPEGQESSFGFGRPASDMDIQPWNIDVAPNGDGLPPGRGTAFEGARIYAAKCAGCHGPTGVEGPLDRLVGGYGTLATEQPIKTVGSYWPYATTLYDYIHRAMPFTAPQSLTPNEVYSLVAWILSQNNIIAEDAVMDAKSLPLVQMPNQNGFVPEPRPGSTQ
jgi:cytochrome c